MRGVVWLILLASVAVVAATALGSNDGLVTIAWGGWRAELSLNLALLLLLLGVMAALLVSRTLETLLSMPRRAGEWRALQRERAAHAALREALGAFFAARYSRAHKAARRAIAIRDDYPDVALAPDHELLARLVAAGSLHRLQDRPGRDAQLQAITTLRRDATTRSAEDGALLLGAEWALEDQDATRAQGLLDALPAGVARRTHALRLRLRAARQLRRTQDALDLARLLAKHQAFSPQAAASLLRALALEHLDTARDAAQLRRQWQHLDAGDRRDPVVLGHAARKAATWDAQADARDWIEPVWAELPRLGAEDRSRVALALAGVAAGAGSDWLERTEQAARTWPLDPAVTLAAGLVCAERQLWGKARQLLEPAAANPALRPAERRKAWRTLARIAADEGADDRAAHCHAQAAAIEG
jgi:HemY protein